MDDFSTGYSSLSYLRQFPIDTLKIDQSFMRQITSNQDEITIVSAIISMGKSLQKRVIAEGVDGRVVCISSARRLRRRPGFLFWLSDGGRGARHTVANRSGGRSAAADIC
ncbi:MAG: EAL domain-containing protein [Oxalobacteraceae bacterium]